MKASFNVAIWSVVPIPRDVLAAYVADAVSCWSGQMHPADERTSIHKVRVTDRATGEHVEHFGSYRYDPDASYDC